jgi:hypothetical protein
MMIIVAYVPTPPPPSSALGCASSSKQTISQKYLKKPQKEELEVLWRLK